MHNQALLEYVKNGGTLIVQYNTPTPLVMTDFAPYPLSLSNDRVTEEDAPVSFLQPNHPLLNTPNLLTPADLKGGCKSADCIFHKHGAQNIAQ